MPVYNSNPNLGFNFDPALESLIKAITDIYDRELAAWTRTAGLMDLIKTVYGESDASGLSSYQVSVTEQLMDHGGLHPVYGLLWQGFQDSDLTLAPAIFNMVTALALGVDEEEKVVAVMLLTMVDFQHAVIKGTSCVAELNEEVKYQLQDLSFICNAAEAHEPDPFHEELAKESFVVAMVSHFFSAKACKSWDIYLSRLPKPTLLTCLATQMMEITLAFLTNIMSIQTAFEHPLARKGEDPFADLLELHRRVTSLGKHTLLALQPSWKGDLGICLTDLQEHNRLLHALAMMELNVVNTWRVLQTMGHASLQPHFNTFLSRNAFLQDQISLLWGVNGPATLQTWNLNILETETLGTLMLCAFHTALCLAEMHNVTALRGSRAPCSVACRLRHPAKHAQCLVSLLHKFLQLRPMLPGALLELVEEWEEVQPKLFQHAPPVIEASKHSHPAKPGSGNASGPDNAAQQALEAEKRQRKAAKKRRQAEERSKQQEASKARSGEAAPSAHPFSGEDAGSGSTKRSENSTGPNNLPVRDGAAADHDSSLRDAERSLALVVHSTATARSFDYPPLGERQIRGMHSRHPGSAPKC